MILRTDGTAVDLFSFFFLFFFFSLLSLTFSFFLSFFCLFLSLFFFSFFSLSFVKVFSLLSSLSAFFLGPGFPRLSSTFNSSLSVSFLSMQHHCQQRFLSVASSLGFNTYGLQLAPLQQACRRIRSSPPLRRRRSRKSPRQLPPGSFILRRQVAFCSQFNFRRRISKSAS